MGPDLGEGWGGLATNHVISISVRDSAAMLDIISGPEVGDPYYAPHKSIQYLDVITKPLTRLNIAITETFDNGIKVDPECIKALADAAKLCEALGHKVTLAKPKFNKNRLHEAIHIIASANTAMFLKFREELMGRTVLNNEIEPTTAAFTDYGKKFGAMDYAKAIFILHNESRQIGQFFVDHDILITPTTATPPVKIGLLAGNTQDVEKYFRDQQAFGPYTAIANATGQPAMSVPLYWTKDNIPIGTQFIGRFGEEATLFQLAAELEKTRPWKNKLPSAI
jgi:Asp-tRNA(Asn)/Glu-tRNA(Gln) amidotransferase A subunit family amidase